MHNLLFPHRFQLIGWILFIPALICGVFAYYETPALPDWAFTAVNDIIIIGITLGSVFIVCSKERDEDEMISAIRLSSLLNSVYIYTAILITGTLLVNGSEFIKFMMFNMVLMPIIFVINFRLEIRRHHKQAEDEE
ncbi:MAG: hypothetical protein K2M07_08175 [Muribaculaceae bacterium]|nr:hypothetical protein [Muribaculaceae bacterium]